LFVRCELLIASCSGCPSGFTYVSSVRGCYRVVLDNLEWTLAGLRCKSLHPDAHLLIVNNAAEQQAIETLLSAYSSKKSIVEHGRLEIHTVNKLPVFFLTK